MANRDLKPMREGAKVSVRTTAHADTRLYYTTCNVEGRAMMRPFVHEDCQCNEMVSIRNRVVAKVPRVVADLAPYQSVARWIGMRLKRCNLGRLSYEDAVKHMPPAKQQSYLVHAPENLTRGVGRKQAKINAFVKFERLPEFDKDPRMIQFREKAFGLELATYLKAIEHGLYALRGDGNILPKGRAIAKGRNMFQRASDIQKKFSRYRKPVVLSIDASRFDMHVQIPHLKLEHLVYNTAFSHDSALSKLLKLQLVNQCRTKSGINYVCPGGRMSGDMNTALGNCVLMVVMVAGTLGREKYDIYDDGDDCLLFMEQDDEPMLTDMVARAFERLGFVLKFENRATELEQITFCQSNPVWNGERYVMTRNPNKVVGFGVSGTKMLNNGDGSVRTYLTSIGVCGMAVARGIPVLEDYYQKLIELGSGGRATLNAISHLDGFVRLATLTGVKSLDEVDVTRKGYDDRTLASFEAAFGLDVVDICILEELIDQLEFPHLSETVVPDYRLVAASASHHHEPL